MVRSIPQVPAWSPRSTLPGNAWASHAGFEGVDRRVHVAARPHGPGQASRALGRRGADQPIRSGSHRDVRAAGGGEAPPDLARHRGDRLRRGGAVARGRGDPRLPLLGRDGRARPRGGTAVATLSCWGSVGVRTSAEPASAGWPASCGSARSGLLPGWLSRSLSMWRTPRTASLPLVGSCHGIAIPLYLCAQACSTSPCSWGHLTAGSAFDRESPAAGYAVGFGDGIVAWFAHPAGASRLRARLPAMPMAAGRRRREPRRPVAGLAACCAARCQRRPTRAIPLGFGVVGLFGFDGHDPDLPKAARGR
jgi:hypothetical protein